MQISTADTQTKVSVNKDIFGCEYNEGLVHQAVTTYMNNARSGNSAQKTRSEVQGGGKKPWRQKGTGRARAGTIRSPIWRSGGVTFAAKPRSYAQKLNKKMYKSALRSILSELNRNKTLELLSDFQVSSPKTKEFKNKMKELNVTNALIILSDVTEEIYLASRNLIDFDICDVTGVNPVSLLKYEKVIMTKDALDKIEEQLK